MRREGQSILEYTVLLVAAIAAILLMQRLLKASLMGSWRQTADTFGGGVLYQRGRTAERSAPRKVNLLIDCGDPGLDPRLLPSCDASIE